jgi:FtsP/CotA-like multicopper oxidase with cupredoxin domain
MYLPKSAPKNRIREAQKARDNRAEIQRALNLGEVTRRDLVKMGIFTATGTLALKHGLSSFAPSAYAAEIPTGTPPSPLFGAQPFTVELPRLPVQPSHTLTEANVAGQREAVWPAASGEVLNAKRESWHNEFSAAQELGGPNPYVNARTGRGPVEGRPPGIYYGHQLWNDYFPTKGYVMSLGRIEDGQSFHPNFPAQKPNSVWTFGTGGLETRGVLPPPLIKIRYGEPLVTRIYNSLPTDRTKNRGFGRNESSIHNHNAHNGAASDGANNAYFFPGQFYDYHWGTTLARADTINTDATDPRASGINDDGEVVKVPGDFRELQGTLWFHDHRFFFTADNVYKGSLGMLNYYSGPDRGNEEIVDGVNLRLPSGRRLPWGNVDFDVNLIISDFALSQDGQYFFDPFDTDGFLGYNMLVNFAYAPYFNVIRRKYRFRLLNACMSRFIRLALTNDNGVKVPIQVICNDGNLFTSPVSVDVLDRQGTAERFDIIVDFSGFNVGDKLYLVNAVEHDDARGPKENVGVKKAFNRNSEDPVVGPVLEFRVSSSVESVDEPGFVYTTTSPDISQVPAILTEAIPLVEPVRTRELEFKRGPEPDICFPECGDKEAFPWGIRINGESTHFMNANRSSLVYPKPGDIEHWTLKNGGGGWDHPIHLHFEEGITISRTVGDVNSPLQIGRRKDVWRLGEAGEVVFQIQFGEYGGAYVTHCHNTVHEDFAMLMRIDILKDDNGNGEPFAVVGPTPNPTPDGVAYLTPEILPEGDPRSGGGSSA